MGVVVQRDGGSVHQRRSADSDMLGHLCGTSPALRRVAGRPGPSVGTTAPPGARDGPDNGATGPVQLRRERWRRRGPCSARRPSPAGVGEWGWARTSGRVLRWAELAAQVAALQQASLAELGDRPRAGALARSESTAELLCAELSAGGLPMDRAVAEGIVARIVARARARP